MTPCLIVLIYRDQLVSIVKRSVEPQLTKRWFSYTQIMSFLYFPDHTIYQPFYLTSDLRRFIFLLDLPKQILCTDMTFLVV